MTDAGIRYDPKYLRYIIGLAVDCPTRHNEVFSDLTLPLAMRDAGYE